jgi:hypothetical protein
MDIIAELQIFIERAEKAKGDDIRLAAIMTDMEHRYKIPLVLRFLPEWKEKTPEAERILKTYHYISGLRDL